MLTIRLFEPQALALLKAAHAALKGLPATALDAKERAPLERAVAVLQAVTVIVEAIAALRSPRLLASMLAAGAEAAVEISEAVFAGDDVATRLSAFTVALDDRAQWYGRVVLVDGSVAVVVAPIALLIAGDDARRSIGDCDRSIRDNGIRRSTIVREVTRCFGVGALIDGWGTGVDLDAPGHEKCQDGKDANSRGAHEVGSPVIIQRTCRDKVLPPRPLTLAHRAALRSCRRRPSTARRGAARRTPANRRRTNRSG